MTQSTPESLTRTDFRRLIRTSPEAAQERLEALISDPEALALYADSLTLQGDLGTRPAFPVNWDDLRRRILAEGLGGSAVDEETLAWLASDFDALAELQFDLYSADAPPQAWLRAMEVRAVGSMSLATGETGSVDDLPAAPAICKGSTCDLVPSPGARDDGRLVAEEKYAVGTECPFLPPPLATSSVGECDPHGVSWLESTWEGRLNFQQCLVDRRGSLHWSNLTVDDPVNGPRIILFVHHDTMADLASPAFDVDLAWATLGASSAVCLDVLGFGETLQNKSRVLLSTRACDADLLTRRRPLLRWFRARNPFSWLWTTTCNGKASRRPIERDTHLDDLMSKLRKTWDECGLMPLVLVVDAGFEAPSVNTPRACYRCSDDHASSGRVLQRQLRAPQSSKCPGRMLTNTV